LTVIEVEKLRSTLLSLTSRIDIDTGSMAIVCIFFLLHFSSSLTKLPAGLSPYARRTAKESDVQGSFRSLATVAIQTATKDKIMLQELEFPPLIGGRLSKTQYDDFDNVSELNANADFGMQLIATLASEPRSRSWIVFPDLRECQVAGENWPGKSFQAVTKTTIEDALNTLDVSNKRYVKPWGSTIASTVNGAFGNGQLLGDEASKTPLTSENTPPDMIVGVQPGNGGPVEDWINFEQMSECVLQDCPLILINGALDKIRSGYYPNFFFPKLAKTVDRFYRRFEQVLYLKPISEKGVVGWIFRVYPEPFQVLREVVKEGDVVYDLVGTFERKPTYSQVVDLLIAK